jgi:hypothetical protein
MRSRSCARRAAHPPLQAAAPAREVRAILIHRVREARTGNPTEDSYGVTGVNGRRKPAYCALVVLLSPVRFC